MAQSTCRHVRSAACGGDPILWNSFNHIRVCMLRILVYPLTGPEKSTLIRCWCGACRPSSTSFASFNGGRGTRGGSQRSPGDSSFLAGDLPSDPPGISLHRRRSVHPLARWCFHLTHRHLSSIPSTRSPLPLEVPLIFWVWCCPFLCLTSHLSSILAAELFFAWVVAMIFMLRNWINVVWEQTYCICQGR